MPPMLKDLGWSATQYSAAMIVSGLVSVLTLTFVDKVYKKFSVKPVLLASVMLFAVGYLLKTFTHSYLYYCIIMAVIGVGGAFVLYVPVPMLLNAWFVEKRGFAIGIAVLSSGVAGAVLNPIISSLIQSLGWRTAIIITAAISMAISMPFLIFVVRGKPEDMNLLPYGATKGNADINADYTKNAEAHVNARFSKKEIRKKFVLCLVLASLLNLLSVVSSHLANFAQMLGLAAAVGATVTSTNMVGNILSKAVLGSCMDHFGQYKAILVSMAVVFVGYILLALSPKFIPLMYIGALLLGTTAAHNTMIAPAMVENFAIGEEYTKYISKVSMGVMLASAFAHTVASGIMELTGTYVTVWILYAFLEMGCIILLTIFYGRNER